MKLNTAGFRTRCQHPLLLALGCQPLLWVLLCNIAFPLRFAGSLMLGLTVLLSWGCLLLPGKHRLLAGAASALLLLFAGVCLFPLSEGMALLLVPAVCIALLLGSLPFAGWPKEQELPIGWHFACMGAHALVQLLLTGADKIGKTTYNGLQPPLVVSFLCCTVLTLLCMNRASLRAAAQSRSSVPLLMRRQNLVITMAILVLGVLIAAIPTIAKGLNFIWDKLLHILARLISLLTLLMPEGTVAGSGAPAAESSTGLGETAAPSAFALLMEKVMMITAFAVVVVGASLLLYFLGKQLWRLVKQLWARTLRYGSAASADYEDEITDTRAASDAEQSSLLTHLRRFVPEDERNMTPAQRVRSRYRRIKRRHDDWSDASTARETLPQEAAALYEQARYSGQPLTAEDAERFRQDTKGL